MDPKVYNLLKFVTTRLAFVIFILYCYLKLTNETDIIRFIGGIGLCIAAWRISLSVYRRRILPAKHVKSYGKWAIVTGTTSGIGKAFSEYLAKRGMSLLIISRSEGKLKEQVEELKKIDANANVRYMCYDFTDLGPVRKQFYSDLDTVCKELHTDGGIGLLINNVGIANEIPKNLEEFSDIEVDDLINCNIFSTVSMTRTVMKYMKETKSGAIVSISSGSGNHPGPFLALYSATKAFITQFSRSMQVECWGSGVDFLVVTPFYVVSNLYKRKTGTLLAPLPGVLVKGTMAQLGKQYVWQGHGYWFHGIVGNFSHYYWNTTARYRKMMVDNRKRYDEKKSAKEKNT